MRVRFQCEGDIKQKIAMNRSTSKTCGCLLVDALMAQPPKW